MCVLKKINFFIFYISYKVDRKKTTFTDNDNAYTTSVCPHRVLLLSFGTPGQREYVCFIIIIIII